MSGISLNPMVTSQPFGTFDVTTQGYYQGDFVDDSSSYQYLDAGQIASSVTQPIWGGMAITETLSSAGEGNLGNQLTLASAAGNVTGITTFLKNGSAIITAGASNVPQVQASMTANFFRFGSNARLKVAVLNSYVATLEGGAINQTLYWDPALQQLTAEGTSGAFALPATTKVISVNTNSKVVSYNSGTGAVTWESGAVAIISI
ncbi:hypothetical protein [Dyella caseinilytica]|uniref:Uncharacterized protein n=1 Tax=Dyella caseinilytica TaxID=1849581 RepID=A0ABX7GZ86_9GAMM|nr:hypothetical protein [Dyella caseinilytica]QRN55248.1 hypothetical protein ISN74_07935 [Dyella caseinilytica]GGA00403.1 hypothetical protein GCM10011408_21660 [Dyella caseinilytica]